MPTSIGMRPQRLLRRGICLSLVLVAALMYQGAPGASGVPIARGAEAALGAGPRREAGLTVTIAAAGDISCDPSDPSFHKGWGTTLHCREASTAAIIKKLNPTAVLPLGDEQYVNGSLSRFHNSYALSWGKELSISRPVPGNHEYETPGAAGYFAYFGAHAGPTKHGWYAYTLGGWRMLALNSNCWAVGGCGPGSPQYNWLKRQLHNDKAKCTLAYFHHPRFSSGPHGDDLDVAPFWNLLYAYHVDIVLNGHDHLYERFIPLTPAGKYAPIRGIREFVVGTGGDEHYPVVGVKYGSAKRIATKFGVLRLIMRPTSYKWQFVAVSGATVDSGLGTCH
jgi:acid phosphatase type 7